MSRFDLLIERVTHGLRGDRELRLEVSQELRGHLEDRVTEAVAGGMNEEEAQEHAVKVFGDEQKLAGELVRANLRRMKMRAVVKWAGRLVLVPAAVVVVVLMMFATVADYTALVNIGDHKEVYEELTGKLDEESLLIVRPAITHKLEDIRLLAERYPDDAAYHAYYTLALLYQSHNENLIASLSSQYNRYHPKEEINIDEALELSLRIRKSESYAVFIAAIERGEELDPDNAMYPFLRASVWAMMSSRLYMDPEHSFQRIQIDKEDKQNYIEDEKSPINRTLVFDEELFGKAMTEFEKGLVKPFYRIYAMAIADRQLELLPQIKHIREYLMQSFMIWGARLPDLTKMRNLARTVDGVAMSRMIEGDLNGALNLTDKNRLLGYKLGADGDNFITVLYGQSIVEFSIQTEYNAFLKSGMAREADSVAGQYKDYVAFMRNELWGRDDSAHQAWKQARKMQGGLMLDEIGLNYKGYQYDIGPYRRVEYSLVDYGAMMTVAGGLLMVAMFVMLRMAVHVLQWRRERDWPVMIFVGWRRMLKVVGLGVIVPLGVYVLYSISPLSGREYGLNYTFGRLVIEYLILMCVVGWLVNVLAKQAILQRAGEIGLAEAADERAKTVSWKWSVCMLGLMVIGLVIVRWQEILIISHAAMGTEHTFKCHSGSWREFAYFTTGLGMLLMILGPVARSCWPKIKKGKVSSKRKLSGYGLLLGMVYMLLVIPLWGLATLVVSVQYGAKQDDLFLSVLGGVMCLVVLILIIRGVKHYGWAPRLGLRYPMAVNGSVSRSIVPILLLTAVIIGGAGSLGLGKYHQVLVRQMPMLARQELTHTNARLLKERLSAEHEVAMEKRR